ncbi:tyrosine-type recombinase/integrase [Acidovorax soli]|uniref:Site-specific recombinase XerD n=1 Tax=Acidovorax soli TaxID=592050 RepID=A0A1H4F0W4_9BURK|nr:tyrosine-type recombinase/integrase [Acidovorax soli]SEA90841.1 Site-specific recombinase XerD [Acidovorax soli]
MLEQLFPKYHQRYVASPFGDQLELFARWLVDTGYSRDVVQDHVRRLRQVLELGDEPFASMLGSADLDQLFAAAPGGILFAATRRAFARCLADQGRWQSEPDVRPHAKLLDAYRDFLYDVRGLSHSTVVQHVSTVAAFLQETLPAGLDISALTREQIERHVVATGKRISRQSLQHWVARLRSFLRFCHVQGLMALRLDAIDSPRVYRGELPPRAIPWATVQALLQSIDRKQATGWRDYTILYLLAHYGLRPCEVASLRLDSIDWQAKTLRVDQRKTRSVLLLPLADQTLRVIKRYLNAGRTGSTRPELFLRARGPSGAIKHTAVCKLYQTRAARSGLALQGTSAYCLRHSFAMRLLHRGVGIKAIGDVLGHRGLESTCAYLRLQLDALRDVALPVPQAQEV